MRLQDIASDSIEWPLTTLIDRKGLVQEIQQCLNRRGFNAGSPDGIWGRMTQTAYAAFAKANRLNSDEITPQAAKLLLQQPSPGTTPTPQPPTPQPKPPTPTPQPPTPQPQPPTPQPNPQPPTPAPQPPTPQPNPQPPTPTPQPPTPQPNPQPPTPAPQPPTPNPQPPTSKTLSDRDYQDVARMIGCSVAAVRAVVEVESSGSGFLPDGRPKILFEAHWFSEFTKSKYDKTHPDISSYHWNRNLYVGGAGEWLRIQKAGWLDREAALKSASWGLGQVMGFNFKVAGYADIDSFVKDMYASEGRQLMAMFNFIKANNLSRHLISGDWQSFARGYNGEGYRQGRYDEKLAAAYQRWLNAA